MTLWQFILWFAFIQLINVILNTFRSIITTKGGKIPASLINAATYGFYVIVIIYTAGEMSMWIKIAITVVVNLVGVYFSMWLLEKMRKDRLWEITATINSEDFSHLKLRDELARKQISFNFLQLQSNSNEFVFHIYSKTQKQSTQIKQILSQYSVHYIVHEQNAKL